MHEIHVSVASSAHVASPRHSVKPSTYSSSTDAPSSRSESKGTGTSSPSRDSGLRRHEEVTRVMRRAGYSDEFIRELLSQLPDPVDLQRDQQILGRYRLSSERLMDRLGGSP